VFVSLVLLELFLGRLAVARLLRLVASLLRVATFPSLPRYWHYQFELV
jgi:hypothetical protein